MSSLFGGISIAMSSMLASQSAISVTANNIANVNTDGYSRQRANILEGDAVPVGTHMAGTGVTLDSITSLRDRVLELRIDAEKQQQGSLEAQVGALGYLEVLFSPDGENLGDSINKFFNSLSDLSSDPASIPLRQSVLMNAANLVNEFNNISATLHQRQFSIDLDIQQAVDNVNEISTQIAKLNQQISAHGSSNEGELNALVDRRNLLLQQLSSLIGNQVSLGDDGLTVTTAGGEPLVVGFRSFALKFSELPDGSPQILATSGHDITRQIEGGKLHGLLTVRNSVIPGLLADVDAIAVELANSFNAAHRAGFDLNGNSGTDFFVPPTADGVGAAAALAINITAPAQLAASSDGNAGSNGNLNNLVAVREQPNAKGNRILDQYAQIAFQVGSVIAHAKTELEASELIGQQLADQRGVVSGVSLDEEAADLIRFQRAYEAAARVLTILSDLTEVSVNLGR